MRTRSSPTETVTISLPRAMRKIRDELRAREHRTTSELLREALRVYAARATTYMPTAAELRAIAKGRASESLTLEEARTYVDRHSTKSRAQKPSPRARKRA